MRSLLKYMLLFLKMKDLSSDRYFCSIFYFSDMISKKICQNVYTIGKLFIYYGRNYCSDTHLKAYFERTLEFNFDFKLNLIEICFELNIFLFYWIAFFWKFQKCLNLKEISFWIIFSIESSTFQNYFKLAQFDDT